MSAFQRRVLLDVSIEDAIRLADGLHYLSTTPGARPGDQDLCEYIECARSDAADPSGVVAVDETVVPPLGSQEAFWMALAQRAFPARGWGSHVDEDVRAVIDAIRYFGYRIVQATPWPASVEDPDAFIVVSELL